MITEITSLWTLIQTCNGSNNGFVGESSQWKHQCNGSNNLLQSHNGEIHKY
jgi:hypothetical protein